MSMQLESSFNEEFLDSFANTIENKFNQSDFNVQFPQLNER